MRVIFHRPITTEDPHQLRLSVPRAQPLSIGFRVIGCEDLRAGAPFLVPLVAPGRQKANHNPQRIRLLHDVVDMIPVVVLRPVLHVRLGRVVVDQRSVAIGVGRFEPIQLRERHCLDHRVT